MFVRVKRKSQTVFLHVEPSHTFSTIKETLASINQITSDKIGLFAPDKVRELVDVATIADQEIENDAIIYMVFRKGETDAFEAIDVATYHDDQEEGEIEE